VAGRTVAEFEEWRERARSGEFRTAAPRAGRSDVEESQFLADMLIPIPETDTSPVTFTCRHFDRESRKCTVYKVRPRMCEGYPYAPGALCQFPGCDVRRSGLELTPDPEIDLTCVSLVQGATNV
jgi:Fe-S-cluster containining protein